MFNVYFWILFTFTLSARAQATQRGLNLNDLYVNEFVNG